MQPIQDNVSKIAGESQTGGDRTTANEASEARLKRMREERQKEEVEKEQRFLHGLQQTIKAQSRFVTYACGGSIPFKTSMATNDDAYAIDPIQVRFDEDGKGISMDFPCSAAPSGELKSLVKACQPATFGRGDKDTHDDEYRKAGKLDRQCFATTFCPYEAGIIDVVSQLLVPQTKRSKHHCSIKVGLKAVIVLLFQSLKCISGRALQAQCLQCSEWQIQGKQSSGQSKTLLLTVYSRLT